MQRKGLIQNINSLKERLVKSLLSVLGVSIAVYIFTLLSIIITAIDYKHVIVNTAALDKSTVELEREYAVAVGKINVSQLETSGYEKVSSSFVVRMDPDANFSLLYGQ